MHQPCLHACIHTMHLNSTLYDQWLDCVSCFSSTCDIGASKHCCPRIMCVLFHSGLRSQFVSSSNTFSSPGCVVAFKQHQTSLLKLQNQTPTKVAYGTTFLWLTCYLRCNPLSEAIRERKKIVFGTITLTARFVIFFFFFFASLNKFFSSNLSLFV